MELLNNLELVDVVFAENGKKATLVFLHQERGEIREVSFNKQSYDQATEKFVDDADKVAKVDQWCEDVFGLTFDTLAQAIGERRDVYAYDRFNSLFEVKMVEKFTKDDLGQIMEVPVTNVVDDGKAIHIEFEYEGKTYSSKMTYADYMEARKEWFVNPLKKVKQYEKFEEKFHFPVSEKENLIGMNIMVEVKLAFNKFIYVDIKPLRKPKK
jgi:hypothetical protein